MMCREDACSGGDRSWGRNGVRDGWTGAAAAFSGTNRRRRRRAVISVADSNRRVGHGYDAAAGGGVGDGPTGNGDAFQGKNHRRAGWRKCNEDGWAVDALPFLLHLLEV